MVCSARLVFASEIVLVRVVAALASPATSASEFGHRRGGVLVVRTILTALQQLCTCHRGPLRFPPPLLGDVPSRNCLWVLLSLSKSTPRRFKRTDLKRLAAARAIAGAASRYTQDRLDSYFNQNTTVGMIGWSLPSITISAHSLFLLLIHDI